MPLRSTLRIDGSTSQAPSSSGLDWWSGSRARQGDRMLASLVFETSPSNTPVLMATAAFLTTVALLATWLPAGAS